MSEFRIQRRYVDGLVRWLQCQPLLGKLSSSRTKFVAPLIGCVNECDSERVRIISKYANKDKNGELIQVIGVDGKKTYDVSQDKMTALNEEFNKYLDENFLLEINDQNQEVVKDIKDFVLNTPYLFGANESDPENIKMSKVSLAVAYSVWRDVFLNLSL